MYIILPKREVVNLFIAKKENKKTLDFGYFSVDKPGCWPYTVYKS